MVSPKEKRSINTLGNVWTLLLNTQMRQIQTVKLEWQSPFDIWAGGDVNPVNNNLLDDFRRNVSKNFNTLRWQPSPSQCVRKITLSPSTPPSPKAHLYFCLSLPSFFPSQKTGGCFSSLKGKLTQSMLCFLPSLSSNDFPHRSFFIVCRWFLAFNLFF